MPENMYFFQKIRGLYIQWNTSLKWECHQFQDILSTASETLWFENIRKRAPFFYQQDFSGLMKEASTKASRYYLQHPFQSDDNLSDSPSRFSYLREVVGVFPGARMNDGTEEELDVDVELLNWEARWYHTQRQILIFTRFEKDIDFFKTPLRVLFKILTIRINGIIDLPPMQFW